MNYFARVNFKRVLPIVLVTVLVLGAFHGAITAAAGTTTPPPVQLNTFGSLPVMLLNLTQSPINFNVSTTSTYYGPVGGMGSGVLPLAAGLSGVYYAANNYNTTSMFTNPLTPAAAVSGSLTSASLLPAANSSGGSVTFNSNYSFGNLFILFPSWTAPGTYNHTQYVSLGDLNNQGAAAASYTVIAGYPSGNGKDATTANDYTTAYALNAAQPCTTSINLNLMNNQQIAATYSINVNSLGAGTSAAVSMGSGFSILGAMHCALDVVTDIATVASGDPLGIADMIVGLASTANGIYQDVSANNGVNAYITTDVAYPATAKGINVSATAKFYDGSGGVLTVIPTITNAQYPGGVTISDNQSTLYEVLAAAGGTLPQNEQNAIFVTTWRQCPPDNYGSALLNGTDTLIVIVINQAVYSANQLQQYVNSNSAALSTAKQYKPTRGQAQDTLNILAILTAMSKDNQQDYKYILDMFNVQGKYEAVKNNPQAVKLMKTKLELIFKKYQNQFPATSGYLQKLSQKQ